MFGSISLDSMWLRFLSLGGDGSIVVTGNVNHGNKKSEEETQII